VDAVTHRPATDIRRSARWLLLLGTLFGLAAMHTLGHTGMHMDQAAHRSAATMTSITAAVQVHLEQPAAMPAASPCTDDHCHDDRGAMSQWNVCLAVLGGLAAFALLIAAMHGGRDRTRAVGETSSVTGASRAPPRRRAGLTITSTAVLRI
jgi:hypothetical protein